MDVLTVAILFQVWLLQSYEAMPTKSRDDWAPNTRSESLPDIPLPNKTLFPSNGNRSWFSYQSNGSNARMGNVGKTGTGNDVQWRQTGTHFSNQSVPNRQTGIFRTFYYSSNNTDGNEIASSFINRGGNNGLNSGNNNPNNSMGGNSSFFFNSGAMNYTGSGHDVRKIFDNLKNNNSAGQIHTFQSQISSSNFTNPDFFQNIRERIQHSLGKNSLFNSSMVKHMSPGPITWHSSGHNQIPEMFNGTNFSSNFVMYANGTRTFNSYRGGFDYSEIQEQRVDTSTTISPLNNVQNITFETKNRNVSLNSLFEHARNSKNRQINQNEDIDVQVGQQIGSVEQHMTSQKDIDGIFNSFQLPVFNRKNLKGSSSDILRDLKEVVQFWMKERGKDTGESSTTTRFVDRETTVNDNVSAANDVDNNSTITPKRRKTTPESNEQILVTNANLNKTETFVQPLSEADERIIKSTDDIKQSQSEITEIKENHEENAKHIKKTIKPKIQTSTLKTTVKPQSSSTKISPIRPFNMNQTDKSIVKQKESILVVHANKLTNPIPTDLPPIFEIPAKIGANVRANLSLKYTTIAADTNKGKLTDLRESNADIAVTHKEKSTMRSPTKQKDILPNIPWSTKEKSTVTGPTKHSDFQPNLPMKNTVKSSFSRPHIQGEFQPKFPITNKEQPTIPGPSKESKFQRNIHATDNEKSLVSVPSDFSKISSNASTERKDDSDQLQNTNIQQIFMQDDQPASSSKSTLLPMFTFKAVPTVNRLEPNEYNKFDRTYSTKSSTLLSSIFEETTTANAIGRTSASYALTSYTTTTMVPTASYNSNKQNNSSNERIKWLHFPSVKITTTSKSSDIEGRTIKTLQDNIRSEVTNERVTQLPDVDKLRVNQKSEINTPTERPSDYITLSQPTFVHKDKKADVSTNKQANNKELKKNLRPMSNSYNTLHTVLPPIFISPSEHKTGISPSVDSKAAVWNMKKSRQNRQSEHKVYQPNEEVSKDKTPKLDSPSKFPAGNKEKIEQSSRNDTSKLIKNKHSVVSSRTTLPHLFNHLEDSIEITLGTKNNNLPELSKLSNQPNFSSHKTPDVMPPIFLPTIVVKESSITNENSASPERNDGVDAMGTNLSREKIIRAATSSSLASGTKPTTRTIKNSRLYTLKISSTKPIQTRKRSAGPVAYSSTTVPTIFSKSSTSASRKINDSSKTEQSETSNIAISNKLGDHETDRVWVSANTNIGNTIKSAKKGVTDERSSINIQQKATTTDDAHSKDMPPKNGFHKTLGNTGTQGFRQHEPRQSSFNKQATEMQHIPKTENQRKAFTINFLNDIMKPFPVKTKDNFKVGGVTVASKIDAIMNLLYRGLSNTVTSLGRIPETTRRLDNRYNTLSGRNAPVPSLTPVVNINKYKGDGVDRFPVSDDKFYNRRKGHAGKLLKYTTAHKSLDERRVRTDVPYVSSAMPFSDTRKVSSGERATAADLRSLLKASRTTEPSAFKSEYTLSKNTDTKQKEGEQNDKLHKITIPILELFLSGRPDLGNVQKQHISLDVSLINYTTSNSLNADILNSNTDLGINTSQDMTEESVAEASKMQSPSDTEQKVSRNVKTGINILNALFPTSPKAMTTNRLATEPPFGLKTKGLSKIFIPRLRP